MNNTGTATMPQQQQQQQQQQPSLQKKKKSKNKKGNKPAVADLGTALETDGAKKTEFNANGLSEQLANELHLNNTSSNSKSNNNNTNSTATSDAKLRKPNKLANGIAKKQSAATVPQRVVNGHDNSLATPAETKANGSTETQEQQRQQHLHHQQYQQQQQPGKKSKSKSNKQKHKESDKVKNCHENCINQEQTAAQVETATTSLAAREQESHVETLGNGFCTATKENNDKVQDVNSFKPNSNETLNKTMQEAKKDRIAAQEAKQEEHTRQEEVEKQQEASNDAAAAAAAVAVTTPASTATTKVDNAAKEDAAASPTLDLSNVHIEYKEYESELQMHDIMRLIQAELSEPYSIYTYRYFIYNWPKLCFLAAHGNEYVGAIVCKLDRHMNVKRGYIAMLAVRKEYRKLKIGTTLVQKAIEAMLADNADEVVLETEMRNLPALRLYENLGFVRDKRLFRYYLNGVDALRLKLWFR